MLENIAPVEQARRSVNVNDILVTPIRVDGKKVGTHYDMTPDSNWKDINKFDKATQVKKTDGSSDALSDHLLKNVRTITELAYKNKYITEQDINGKDLIKNKDGEEVLGAERTPLAFLEIKNGKLIIPDILTAQQTQELMFLIYGKTVNNVDRDPQSRKQPDVLIEDIQKTMSNFSEAGKVDKSAKLILDTQSPQTVLRALNISLRKSVENAIKESTYSTTKDLERKGENATKRLLQRLEVGAHVSDEVDGPTINKVVEGKMGVFTDKKGETGRELEQTVQYDLLMAQAFDVLVPPEARLEMEQAEIAISKERNYMEKAKKMADLTKTRQIWRISMLDYFNASKLIPGTEFSQYANDLNNNKIFSPEEQDLVHKYSKEIGQRKASLDRKSKNGFNDLNIDSVNTFKAQELLLMLKPAGTVQIPEGLNNILSRAHEIAEVVGDSPKEIKTKKDALIKSLIKDSGILNGLQEEKSELAEKILRDVISTKNSIDKRLKEMPNSDVDVKYGALDFASSIDSGIKGIDLLYRRGLSQTIDEADRYYGHDIVRDANEKTHLMRKLKKGEKRSKKNGFGEDLPPGGASSQGEAKMNQTTSAESSVSTASEPTETPPVTAETTEKLQIRNEKAGKLAKILDVENADAITDVGGLVTALRKDGRLNIKFEGQKPKSADLSIPKVNLTSQADLSTLSELSTVLEGIKIEIDTLNLTVKDGESVGTDLNGFNIESLAVNVPDGKAEITTSKTNINELIVSHGSFTLNTDNGPKVLRANSDDVKINIIFDTQESYDDVITKQNHDIDKPIINLYDGSSCSFSVKGKIPIMQIGIKKNDVSSFMLRNDNGNIIFDDASYIFPEDTEDINKPLSSSPATEEVPPQSTDSPASDETMKSFVSEPVRVESLISTSKSDNVREPIIPSAHNITEEQTIEKIGRQQWYLDKDKKSGMMESSINANIAKAKETDWAETQGNADVVLPPRNFVDRLGSTDVRTMDHAVRQIENTMMSILDIPQEKIHDAKGLRACARAIFNLTSDRFDQEQVERVPEDQKNTETAFAQFKELAGKNGLEVNISYEDMITKVYQDLGVDLPALVKPEPAVVDQFEDTPAQPSNSSGLPRWLTQATQQAGPFERIESNFSELVPTPTSETVPEDVPPPQEESQTVETIHEVPAPIVEPRYKTILKRLGIIR